MPTGFTNLYYERPAAGPAEALVPPEPEMLARGDLAAAQGIEGLDFESDEAAARFYLGQLLGRSPLESLRGLAAPEQAGAVPDLQLRASREQALSGTRLVQFEQTHASIPVFGSQAFVDLDESRRPVLSDADLAGVEDVSAIATLSPGQALAAIAGFTAVQQEDLAGVRPPVLNFYFDGTWHLAYVFSRVPAAPPGFVEEVTGDDYHGHGVNDDVRLTFLELDYLVDAHDGTILLYYSANPLLDVPSKCRGLDEDGVLREFWGRQVAAGFELSDPLRDIKTFDLQLQDWTAVPVPGAPVDSPGSDWAAANRAAVSAHVNAMRVYDFYKAEMKRDGIDDKGMELVSVVNCTWPAKSPPPQWFNAVWWKDHMWYGQIKDASGTLRSFARFLDVIAHELTHGVTQYTAGLVYKDQSGALNESFSDIFGIIIKNWYDAGPDSDTGQWDWELGPGLGKNGLPLRDLSDPVRTGDPDHMKDYWHTTHDSGGVHTNSNIHNKAAYNVLTAADAQGTPVFSPREVAILYYLTLTRLGKLADFSKALQILVGVATIFYAGDPVDMSQRVQAIKDAYAAVGIF